jgi:hypothetical protein
MPLQLTVSSEEEVRIERARLERLAKCKSLMHHLRETCGVAWGESKEKAVYHAFTLWKVYHGKDGNAIASTPEAERCKALRTGFEVIMRSWQMVAGESHTVCFSHLESLREHLGEVGVFFFDTAFPVSNTQAELTLKDFVLCWVRFLDQGAPAETDTHTPPLDVNMSEHAEPGLEDIGAHTPLRVADKRSGATPSASMLSKVADFAMMRRHRTIKFALMNCELKTYTTCYEAVVGDVKGEMIRSKVLDFLSLLLIDLGYPLTNAHVSEFIQMFSPIGADATSLTLVDIERGVLDCLNKGPNPHRFFVEELGSPLNPNSFALQLWGSIQQICAIYLVLHVPVRICFDPYQVFFAWEQLPLVLDLFIDMLVLSNLLLSFNIAFMVCACVCVWDRESTCSRVLVCLLPVPNRVLSVLSRTYTLSRSHRTRRVGGLFNEAKLQDITLHTAFGWI